MSKLVAITVFAAVLLAVAHVHASDVDADADADADVEADAVVDANADTETDTTAFEALKVVATGPNLDTPCAAEDKLDFVMCLKMAAWARKSRGTWQGVDDVAGMCMIVNTNPESRTRCADIMGVAKTQPNCVVNPKLRVFYGYLTTRIDEAWCWTQLQSVRSQTGKPSPAESCRAETVSGKPRCLFFHGVGEKGPDFGVNQRGRNFRSRHPGFLLQGLKTGDKDIATYWGQTENNVQDQCEPWFFHTETAVSGWDRVYLQDEYCGAIEALNPAVIFTHSMGNLIIAAGMINKLAGCADHIGRNGLVTRWFGIQGPLQGATPTGIGVLKCKTLVKLKFLKKLIDGRCDEETGSLPASYQSMVLGYQSKEPGNIAQLTCKSVEGKKWTPDTCLPLAYMATVWMSGSLCGMRPTTTVDMKTRGLFKKKIVGWGLTILSKLTHALKPNDPDWDFDHMRYPEQGNDGMVGFASCRLYDSAGIRMRYWDTPDSLYYGATVNHADGTCREGDVPSDPKQQSCAWVVKQIEYVLKQRTEFVSGPAEQEPNGLMAQVRRQNAKLLAARAARAGTPARAPLPQSATPSTKIVPPDADGLAKAVVQNLEDRLIMQQNSEQKVEAALKAQGIVSGAIAGRA